MQALVFAAFFSCNIFQLRMLGLMKLPNKTDANKVQKSFWFLSNSNFECTKYIFAKFGLRWVEVLHGFLIQVAKN
jgi:hypothetical protein